MSELDDHLDALDNFQGIANVKQIVRPTFLSVLCVLAFIGNGLGIIQGLFFWAMSGFYAKLFSLFDNGKAVKGNEMKMIENFLNGITWWAISIIVGSLVCLIGAILMWKLKKSGYFIYILGQIVPILGVLFFFLRIMKNVGVNGGGMFFVFLSAIFPIAFIVMFGLNQKHLK
jgi:hypothetical protein